VTFISQRFSLSVRAALRVAVAGAALLVGLQLATIAVSVFWGWADLPVQERLAMQGIAWHVAAFQLQLCAAVAAWGGVVALLAWLALGVAGLRPSTSKALLAMLGLAAALTAVTLAHRPALFEHLLWRAGGWRAALHVVVVEKIGEHRLRYLLVGVAALWSGRAIWHLHGRRRSVFILLVALAAVIASPPRWRRHLSRSPLGGTPIIVLAADSLRPDHFSSENYHRPTTPSLDALRRKAAWVQDFFVPIASTTSSWASLLTGVYPHRHGVRDMFPLAEQTHLHLPTLPAILATHGYRTAVVSDYAGEMFRRVQFGFDRVDAPPQTSLEVIADREVIQKSPLVLGLFSGGLGQLLFPPIRYLPVNADPALLSDRVEDQLDALEAEGKPFFLLAFYSVTHAPFAAPMPDATLFSDPTHGGPSRYSYELQQVQDLTRASTRPADTEIAQIRSLYDGALHAFDRQVDRILKRLDEDGLKDRLVIVTGDHGENLFEPGTTTEHGKWFEGGVAANRTALLVEGHGVPAMEISGLASGIDFAPTVLQILGIPVPPMMEGVPLLAPRDSDRTIFAETALWLGGEGAAPPGAIAYPPLLELLEVEADSHALVLKRKYSEITVTSKLRAARQGSWELVYLPTAHRPRWTLFDLQADRFAQRDVSTEYPEIRRVLQAKLLGWLREDALRWLDVGDRLVARIEE